MEWRAWGLLTLVIAVAFVNIIRNRRRRARWEAEERAEEAARTSGSEKPD